MSGTIHFSSGKTLEITEFEFRNMSPKLNGKGIKTQKTTSGHLIPLNSMTMEFIEHHPEVIEGDEFVEEARKDSADPVLPNKEVYVEKDVLDPKVLVKEEPKTPDEVLAEMTEKSNCKHEPEKLELYRQHTAKGIRYFPRCSFCGKRERYVSESKIVDGKYKGTVNEKWTASDIANAIDWIED